MKPAYTYKSNDLAWWQREYRGGYGYTENVPATVVKINAKTVTIDAIRRDGTLKRVNVKRDNLTPRDPSAKIKYD